MGVLELLSRDSHSHLWKGDGGLLGGLFAVLWIVSFIHVLTHHAGGEHEETGEVFH